MAAPYSTTMLKVCTRAARPSSQISSYTRTNDGVISPSRLQSRAQHNWFGSRTIKIKSAAAAAAQHSSSNSGIPRVIRKATTWAGSRPGFSTTSSSSSSTSSYKRLFSTSSCCSSSTPPTPATGTESGSTSGAPDSEQPLEPPSHLDPSEKEIFILLQSELNPISLVVKDVSGGCGSMYSIEATSERFRGLSVLKQQRLVNGILGDMVKGWHGVMIKTKVP